MKKFLKLLLCGLAMLCLKFSATAQCTSNCNFPTQYEKNEVVLCIGITQNSNPNKQKLTLSMSRNATLFTDVKFRVITNLILPMVVSINEKTKGSFNSFIVTLGVGNQTLTLPTGDYEIQVKPQTPFTSPGESYVTEDTKLQIKATPNTYVAPDAVWRIETANAINPTAMLGFTPTMAMFPDGTNPSLLATTKGVGHAFVKYAPEHNGQLKKPIIFLDGIDFSTENNNFFEKSVNGQFLESDLVRHGATGWDVLVTGAEDSRDDPSNPQLETFREYKNIFNKLWEQGYDVIFLDFEEGATYIQKNAEVLKALLRKVNSLKVGKLPNTVVGPSMGGQVARIALAEMERDKEDHCTSLYVSFDSPHQGANIPLGLQSMAWAASETGLNCGLWRRLNFPAARQLLVEHLSTDVKNGRVLLSKKVIGSPPTIVSLKPSNLIKESSTVFSIGSNITCVSLIII